MIDDLIQKFVEGKCTAQELDFLKSYFDSDNQSELEEIMLKKWSSENASIETSLEKTHVWSEISSEISKEPKTQRNTRKLTQWTLSIAASLIAIIGLVAFFNSINSNPISTINNGNDPLLVQLEDGTKVWLKTGSSLQYNEHFAASERLVELHGEAYFEVAHNVEKPFKVSHNNVQTVVLGTAFNINTTNQNQAKVSLFNGSVKLVKLNKEWFIKPGEEITYHTNSFAPTISKFNLTSNNILAWKTQKFEFKNQPIEEVLMTLEKHYQINIEYNKDNILNKNITCELDFNENIDNALQVILFPHQLIFTKENGNIIIKK